MTLRQMSDVRVYTMVGTELLYLMSVTIVCDYLLCPDFLHVLYFGTATDAELLFSVHNDLKMPLQIY